MQVLVVLLGLIIVSLILFYNIQLRREAIRQLKEIEERFQVLVRHVRDYAIFKIDQQGRVMSWNEGAEQIKGYREDEVIGKPISIFYTDEEIAAGEPEYNLKKAAEDGRYECLGWRKRKDGSLFYADVVFTALHDSKGIITGYLKITKDITALKRSEDEILRSLHKEKELNEMKSRFVTLASHEFKTPLSVILSSTALIGKYKDADMADRRERHVQRIKANVNNLRQILNDFLSVEKLEEGRIVNRPARADLPGLLGEIVLNMEESCKTGQSIAVEFSGAGSAVCLDCDLLRNVLNNLLSNAIKYSPEQKPVLVTIQYLPDSLRISVRDHGIGIPQEEQAHLFERFFRARNTTGISGTGLGLSIVRRYLDLMNGTIEFSSEEDRGSVFTVIIPVTYEEVHIGS